MKYRVVSVLKDNRPRFLIISDIEEIEILPSKYLKHLDQINASPNTVKSAAFALSYYYNYLQEQTIGLDEITLLSYSEQNKHFIDFLYWVKSGKHTEHNTQTSNKTCNMYLGAVFRYYRWDEEHSNMVFDEETAPIVRKIFQWKIEGLSLPAIADRLDAMNAPNPEFQKYQVGVRTGNATAKKIWNKSSLTTILDNPHYVGDTVLGRTLNAIYKGVKNQHIDREEWIIFPNTHEAIISREDFQKVQELRDAAARTRIEKMERTEKIRATLINLFEDKIVCADCGRKLYFHRKRVDKRKDGAWYAFYECSSSVKRGNLCTPHYTRQDKLEADVLAAIQLQVKAALNYDKLLAKLRNSEGERSIRDQQNALITSLNLKLSGISKKRTRLYEDFTEGILDEEEYAFAKKAYDEQYVDLSRRLDEAVQRKVKFAEAMSEDNKWLTLMKSVSGATMLSHELVDESVELVKVHEDGSIELVMKYGDIYALTVQSIKEVQEAM